MTNKVKRINLRITESQYNDLKDISKKLNIPMSKIISDDIDRLIWAYKVNDDIPF